MTIKAGATETISTGQIATPTGDIRAFLWDMNGYTPLKDSITPGQESK